VSGTLILLRLVALEIAALGVVLLLSGLERGSPLVLFLSLFALIAAGGLAARRWWAEPMALTILTLVVVGPMLLLVVGVGYGASVRREYAGLALLLVGVAAASWVIVYRAFRRDAGRRR
jgi:hypothetical protein